MSTDRVIPKSKADFQRLVKKGWAFLLRHGWGVWACGTDIGEKGFKKNECILLIPFTWYEFIPTSFPVVDLWGKKEKFSAKTHDNEPRFGCLAYGIVKTKPVKRKK